MGNNPLPLTSFFNILKDDSGHCPKSEWFWTWHSVIRIMQHVKRLDNQSLSYESPRCLLIMSYSWMLSCRYDTIDKLSHSKRHSVTLAFILYFSIASNINLLVPELFILILAHPVYKMWIKQEPNTLELWNKLHFEEKKNVEYIPCLKYSVPIFVE